MKCTHCGRTETVKGWVVWRGIEAHLCHANPDGTKSDPDCYHLVTLGIEQIGSRWNEASDEAWGHVVDTILDTYRAQLAAGRNAIQTVFANYCTSTARARALISGAANELEFYT